MSALSNNQSFGVIAAVLSSFEKAREGQGLAATLFLGFALFVCCFCIDFRTPKSIAKLPVAGRRSIFEPDWLLRLRFIRGSREILKQAYEKSRDIFVVLRAGANVVVLADHRYVDEVRSQTRDVAPSTPVFLEDFHAKYTRGEVIGESTLQNRVVQQKLSPSIGKMLPVIKDEMDIALRKEFASCDTETWTEMDTTSIFARVAAHVISRLFLGPTGSDNEEWVTVTDDYTTNVFLTGFILRFVPAFLRPLVAPLLPTYRGLVRRCDDARRIIGELASERKVGEHRVPNDVLQWTMDMADGKAGELELDNLSQRILVLSLSGIHTTALTMAQAFFDMVAHPEHLATLRAELVDVLGDKEEWDMYALARLVKLDSLIKESQRINPVFLLTFNRFLPKDVTLSNGVHLPKGTRIAVPQHAICNDPELVPGGKPDVFDPWRYSRLREQPGNQLRYLLTQTDSVHMAFGYGKYACFGRFLAATEIKMVLAHLLMMFDFKFPEGAHRPLNFTVDGDMYPDRSARVLMKRRKLEGVEASIGALLSKPSAQSEI